MIPKYLFNVIYVCVHRNVKLLLISEEGMTLPVLLQTNEDELAILAPKLVDKIKIRTALDTLRNNVSSIKTFFIFRGPQLVNLNTTLFISILPVIHMKFLIDDIQLPKPCLTLLRYKDTYAVGSVSLLTVLLKWLFSYKQTIRKFTDRQQVLLVIL